MLTNGQAFGLARGTGSAGSHGHARRQAPLPACSREREAATPRAASSVACGAATGHTWNY